MLTEAAGGEVMAYEPFDPATANVTDRIAWALCQIIDDDAPMRWTRYRFAAVCIAHNPEVMADLAELSRTRRIAAARTPEGQYTQEHAQRLYETNVALNKELAEAEELLRKVKGDGGASQTLLLEIEAFFDRGW